MIFSVLGASVPADCSEWQARIDALPPDRRDLHFEPGYCAAYAAEQDGAMALCALGDNVNGFVIYPFLLRPSREVACAYGYGGYVGGCSNPPFLSSLSFMVRDFGIAFNWWNVSNGVTREFYRLHPFVHPYASETEFSKREKEIVWMDLSVDPESELRKGHRSSVARARREGIKVEQSGDLEYFRAMYGDTMDRLGAHDRWRWSDRLLPALRAAYPSGFQLLIAHYDNNPICGCVLLGAHQTCYYHYAASWDGHRDAGAGNLLVVEAAKWARTRGFKRLHLGGGTTPDPDDSLLRFKAGFSKKREWVYKYEREYVR